MKPDFWVLVGSDYEVMVFPTENAAALTKLRLERESPPGYYAIFPGHFGTEFSGWIGRNHNPLSFSDL